MENTQNHLFKIIGTGVIISFGSFFSGFILYYLSNRRKMLGPIENEKATKPKIDKNKNNNPVINSDSSYIPLDTLERIITKVKNKIVILLANLYDKTILMNIVRQNNETAEEKDIVVETISTGELAKLKENEEHEQKSSINLTSQKKNLQKLHQLKVFFNSKQILDSIIKQEVNIVNGFGYTTEKYLGSLRHYIQLGNENIKKHVDFLSNFKSNIENDKLMDFDFGDIKKNYLKLVTNIYYMNMRRVQKSFRNKYIDKDYLFKDEQQIKEIMNKLYSEHLKESRSEVANFFNINENKNLDLKIMLRLYYYYLNPFDPNRIKMDEVNQEVNEILTNLSMGIEYPVLLYDNSPNSITGPRDLVLDFKHVLKKKNSVDNLRFERGSVSDSLEERRENSLNDDSSINQTAASRNEKNFEKLQNIHKKITENYRD